MRWLVVLGAAATFGTGVPARGATQAPAASGTPPAAAQPAAAQPAAELDAIRAELARQAAEIDALRAAAEAGKHVRSRLSVRLSGFIQVDWIVHDQASENEINDSNGTLLNQDRFTLRRGHVRVDADMGPVSGALEIDANTTNGPQVRPIDAEVSLRWPFAPDSALPTLVATAGLMPIPFGYEVQELDWIRPFLERATVLQALFPGNYDLGVRLHATYRFVDWAIAAMNGSPIGSLEFPDLDPVHQKDIVSRIGIDVELARRVRFQAGMSADVGTGFHPGTPTTKSVLVWDDLNGDGVVEPNEIMVIPGSAATPSSTFPRFGVGGDARLAIGLPFLGDLAIRAEVVSAINLDRGLEVADPVATGRDLREIGWYVGATQELTRWAEIGARYDRYDPDADATQQQGVTLVPVNRSYSTWALMAMARYGNQRLVVEYDVNTNPLGIAPSGSPTTLADNALTLRAQCVF